MNKLGLITSSCGVVFASINVGKVTVYFAPIKTLEKIFKTKIKPKKGDLVLGELGPKYFTGKKWIKPT